MRVAKSEPKQQLAQQPHTVRKQLQKIPVWGWILGVLTVLGGLGACNASLSPSTTGAIATATTVVTPKDPDTDRITLDTVIRDEPPSLDPALATDSASIFFIRQMFVGLTGFNQDANVIPSLATNWAVSDNGLEWTFYLRDDINWVYRNPDTGKFTSLGAVTAHDVVYGVTRTLDPRTASDYAYVTYVIEGAAELNTANPQADNFEELLAGLGVSAPDDKTVVFRLKKPAAYFPSIAGMWVTFPQPRAAIEQWGDAWTEAGLIVTNGPYTLRQWDHNASIIIEKNPLWINANDVQIELFGGPIIQEASTAMAMYENNQIDMMADPGLSPPLLDIERIQADAHLSRELYIAPRLCTYYYGFINTKPPFDNPLIRKAFAAAIDRATLIKDVIKGGQRPAHSFAPPGIFGNVANDMDIGDYLIETNYADQVTQARQWLAEAGHSEGEGLAVVLRHNTSEAHAQIAQAVQTMWQEAFPRAQVTIEAQEWAKYLSTLNPDSPDKDKPNIYRLGWCADYPDANNWLNDVFNSKSGSNYARYNNPEFDALVEEAAFEADPAKRRELYRQAEDIFINQDAAIAPIFYYSYNRLYKPWLTKVVISPVIGDPIAEWRIDREAKNAARGE